MSKELLKQVLPNAIKAREFAEKKGKLISAILNEYRNKIASSEQEKRDLMKMIISGVKLNLLDSEWVNVDKVEHDLIALESDIPDDVYDISSYIKVNMLDHALTDLTKEVSELDADIAEMRRRIGE